MARPPKCRRVAFLPGVTYFKPAGIPLRALEEVRLSVEEAEAIRLKDLEGLEQEQGAEKMNISRPTFQRVLASGRLKIADALLNGKAIRIEGGNFEMSPLRFSCAHGHEWDVPFEVAAGAPPQICPACNTSEIMPLQPPGPGWGRWGRCGRGRGRQWR
jgi:predicted DNA-binding protein (UPF0251 family)